MSSKEAASHKQQNDSSPKDQTYVQCLNTLKTVLQASWADGFIKQGANYDLKEWN